ncbi:MAG: GSCFA domain-containing protein [Candidatus Marinimicrobia bacterium]|nr:GSCFA domain-containing protein [Candidatus Neomarinimicrobiota bacterium]MCF7880541.1 GSCFA domain-containing protein [Candidatus Neomarinimicrobiota bacterium]
MTTTANAYKDDIIAGEQHFQNGELEKALELFTSVIQEEPENTEALNDAGVVNSELGQTEQAIEYFEKVLALQPSNENAFYNLLDQYFSQNQKSKARSIFEKFAGDINDSAVKDQYREALELGADGFIDNDNNNDIDEQIAEVEQLFQQGDTEKATKLLKELYRDHPEHLEVLNDLGVISSADENYEAAIDYFLRALASAPNHQDVRNNLIDMSSFDKGRELLQVRYHSLEQAKYLDQDDRIIFGILTNLLEQETEYRAAFTSINITPDVSNGQSIALQGYAGPPRETNEVLTPLTMQMLLIEDSEYEKTLLVSADIFGFGQKMVSKVRELLKPWGIPAERIILNASHTHYAPGTVSGLPPALGPYYEQYATQIVQAIAQQMESLWNSLQPCYIYSGEFDAQIGVNRRLNRNGTVEFGVNPDGYYPRKTPFLEINLVQDEKNILLVNHGCHPTGLGGSAVITADYPAYLREFVKSTVDSIDVMFLQGAAGSVKEVNGDAKTPQFAQSPQDVARNGKKLAEVVLEAKENVLMRTEGKVTAALTTLEIPYQAVDINSEIAQIRELSDGPSLQTQWADILEASNGEASKESFDMEMSKLSLGGSVKILTFPGEPVGELARSILSRTENSTTQFILGYTNGLQAYLPNSTQVKERGYEADTAKYVYSHPAAFSPDIEKVILAGIDELNNKLNPKRSTQPADTGQAFFTLSSGRCGTMTLSHILDTATNARVYHHPQPYLVDQTLAAYHENIDTAETFWQARKSVITEAWQHDLIFGELDHNMTPFTTAITEEIPDSKFIVLVRNPWDFVRSGMRRNYYNGHPWDSGRLRPEPSHPDFERWQAMSQFEKVCWLWNETYTRIQQYLEDIPNDRYHIVRFEDMIENPEVSKELFDFLGLTGFDEEEIQSILETPLNKQTGGSFPKPEEWAQNYHYTLLKQCKVSLINFNYDEQYRPVRNSNKQLVQTTTIWDFKKFNHQKYPPNIKPKLFTNIDKDNNVNFISKSTPITSMGSCFARNVAKYLMSKGFNYLVTEKPFQQASAHWDQVFNTASIRQIFEYTFDQNWNPLTRWWPKGEMLQDPFRRDILYNKNTAEEDFENHRAASRNALVQSDVVIITLGLIETWRDKRDGMTYYRVPSPRIYNPDIHEFYVQTVDDCLNDLDKVWEIVSLHNPNADIIITVSPVPLFATFRMDVDVVTANTLSKSTLRVAADYFSFQHNNVHYFPSYEIVMNACPAPFEDDGRHVKQAAINEVMSIFEKKFVKKEQ